MLDRVRRFLRASHLAAAGSAPAPEASTDLWRFAPASLESIWSRAAVIHFPTDAVFRRRPRGARTRDQDRGRGLCMMGPTGDFQGFRAWEPGDDPRSVDWRATARTRQPMVRQLQQESRRSIGIVVDVSASLRVDQGLQPTGIRPIDMAFETAVWLGAAALQRQLPLSVKLVSDRPEMQLRNLAGRRSLVGLVDSFERFRPEGIATDWAKAVMETRPFEPGSLVFWISDFTWLPDPVAFRSSFPQWYSLGVRIMSRMPPVPADGHLVRDAETGTIEEPSPGLSAGQLSERAFRWGSLAGVPLAEICTGEPRPELVLAQWLKGPRHRAGSIA